MIKEPSVKSFEIRANARARAVVRLEVPAQISYLTPAQAEETARQLVAAAADVRMADEATAGGA